MMDFAFTAFITVVIGLYALAYSRTSVDPDWAYFNLRAFTGSLYGRDFADCKTPGVHIWYWLIAKAVGADVRRIKFANHVLVSLPAYLILHEVGGWQAVAYVVLVNSQWLLGFHGNVGQVPAALIAVSLFVPAPWNGLLWLLAVGYEPKLVVALVAAAVMNQWWYLASLAPFAITFYMWNRKEAWFRAIWESSVTIPLRMAKKRQKNRKGEYPERMPWFVANPLVFLVPFVLMSSPPDWMWWVPFGVYVLTMLTGTVIRQNHFIPIAPFLAVVLPPHVAAVLFLTEMISTLFVGGDIWRRHYTALAEMNADAEIMGLYLREKPGTLYVNGLHSGIYLYARKPVQYGFVEQAEIREVAHERRQAMLEQWKQRPADWFVQGEFPGLRFTPRGYEVDSRYGPNIIYRRV